MLDVATRQRIDTARDILVGKVPDPKSQVEQITLALMYKFMDDIDASSVDLGGKPSFFTGDFAQYSWHKIVGHRIGAVDALKLYSDGITKMGENPNLPLLFRSMFNNAYLPYRDPETLRTFLQVINEFDYDNSERMGDAFEYLLSIMGSQGDAGQFRTPRHIIDFIVEIVDPKKEDTILDPACGTAGFLISAYKHIVGGKGVATIDAQNGHHPGLTPDERVRLAQNVRGYDISPDMVRLSLVNLYLHGFNDPHIYEYDTLTSEDRWSEYANVILANPPFMSPKGGIRPHNRFSVKSKRSEVLFVDYIAEHLTSDGRAGVIVPEGIIFQSQNAHKQLRKMLVQDYLVAVISLPSGIFNPYSGVKTSILILDRSLARRTDSIAFFKVENDGFDLGAQRRPIDKNDLPRVKAEAVEYLRQVRDGKSGGEIESDSFLVVDKDRLAKDGEFNLTGERFKVAIKTTTSWPMVELGTEDLFEFVGGGTPKSNIKEYWDGGVPWITLADLPAGDTVTEITSTERTISEEGLRKSAARMIPANSVVVSSIATIGRIGINRIPISTNQQFRSIVIKDPLRATPEYIAIALTKLIPEMQANATGSTYKGINKSRFGQLAIPLPKLETQQALVAEIESYQRVIDGARAVVENWEPRITIGPEWPMVELGTEDLFEFVGGGTPKSNIKEYWDGGVPWITLADLPAGDTVTEITSTERTISEEGLRKSAARMIPANSVVVSSIATIGRIGINRIPISTNQQFRSIVIKDPLRATPEYIAIALTKLIPEMQANATGSTYKGINKSRFGQLAIPLPKLETQQALVAEIAYERELVDANRQLIKRMEAKVKEAVERVWGD